MKPHNFTKFGAWNHEAVGIDLDRIVTWQVIRSLGQFGTCIELDNGKEIMVAELPHEVAAILAEHGTERTEAHAE